MENAHRRRVAITMHKARGAIVEGKVAMTIVEELELRQYVAEAEALEAADHAFRALAEGHVVQPPPMGLEIPEARGEVHVKGASIRGAPVFAIKIASGFYDNPSKNLPTGSGLVMVFDASTGFPLALFLDNAYLTDLRTAGAGALAVRWLGHRRARKVAVVGSGVQARYQIRAVSRVCDWEAGAAWSPHRIHCEKYCAEVRETFGRPFQAAGSVEEAVDGAELVITVTPARSPLVEADWIVSHATVIAVGSDGPDKQELSPELLGRADKVVVDRLSQCLELGELHHAVQKGLLKPSDVHAELGEVVLGRKTGREGDELVVCDLTGVGVQDAAIAEMVWKKISAKGNPGMSPSGHPRPFS